MSSPLVLSLIVLVVNVGLSVGA